MPCPLCVGPLKCIGSRYRSCIQTDGERIYIIVRRLRCKDSSCWRIHHELPDMLVPYKRHASASIEKILSLPGKPAFSDISAEDGTFQTWNRWFRRMVRYWHHCMQAIGSRLGRSSVEESVSPSLSPLQALLQLVGPRHGWLARIVRPAVNAGLWVHTHSEWMPEPP
jgi:hypothetical protein